MYKAILTTLSVTVAALFSATTYAVPYSQEVTFRNDYYDRQIAITVSKTGNSTETLNLLSLPSLTVIDTITLSSTSDKNTLFYPLTSQNTTSISYRICVNPTTSGSNCTPDNTIDTPAPVQFQVNTTNQTIAQDVPFGKRLGVYLALALGASIIFLFYKMYVPKGRR